jgi:translation initiation factor 1A
MPPNLKGGKKYKKNSKKGADDGSIIMIDRQPGQQVARVIKVLGNRNMSCYCNDNKIRVCHVRGKMRGRVFVEQGDIVLISLREFEEGASTSHDDLNGDILAKYPSETFSRLKKEEGVNPKLFLQLETMEGGRLAAIGEIKNIVMDEENEGFDFDRGDDEKKEADKAGEDGSASDSSDFEVGDI